MNPFESRDWLPDLSADQGLGGWYAELRAEHHRRVDAYEAARGRAAAVRRRFADEDRNAAAAIEEQVEASAVRGGIVEAPAVTPPLQREVELRVAGRRVDEAHRALMTTVRSTVRVLFDDRADELTAAYHRLQRLPPSRGGAPAASRLSALMWSETTTRTAVAA